MKAKDTSQIGMIVGALSLAIVFVVVLVKYFINGNIPTVDEAKALIVIGVSPAIPFSPVFVSTWLDKIVELKNGRKSMVVSGEPDIQEELEKEMLQ